MKTREFVQETGELAVMCDTFRPLKVAKRPKTEIAPRVEEMLRLIARAMKDLDLAALTKLKMALVSPKRIIGVNVGLGHQGETDPAGDPDDAVSSEMYMERLNSIRIAKSFRI